MSISYKLHQVLKYFHTNNLHCGQHAAQKEQYVFTTADFTNTEVKSIKLQAVLQHFILF